MTNSLKNRIKQFSEVLNTDPINVLLVFICAAAVFCHYKVTSVILFICSAVLVFIPKTSKKIFFHKSAYLFFLFVFQSAVVAFIYNNRKGFLLSLTFLFIAIIGFYLRNIMTKELFEWSLNLLCLGCVIIFIGCFVTKIIYFDNKFYRLTLWFANSNYLAAILSGCVIICAYKVINKKGLEIFYYLIALGCGICIYFTGSMFAMLEVLIGVAAILALTKKHKLLKYFLILCSFGMLLLILMPNLLPRITESQATTDNRILIWQDTINEIPNSIWFGRGFYAYRLLDNTRYFTSHAHNFLLDSLLSCGVVGTVVLGAFFFFYYRLVFLCNRLLRKTYISSLILAVSSAVLLHSTTDMVMLWSQTALFYALILSGLGADEKVLQKIKLMHKD